MPKKGMSLAIETIVIIVLAFIVLFSLLLFFTGTFNPGADRIKLEQQRVDLCSKFISQNSECRGQPTDISLATDPKVTLQDVCNKLGVSTVQACCSGYCDLGKLKCESSDIPGSACKEKCDGDTPAQISADCKYKNDDKKPTCCAK